MKTLIIALLALLLASPAWGGERNFDLSPGPDKRQLTVYRECLMGCSDPIEVCEEKCQKYFPTSPEVKRMWPGGGYIETQRWEYKVVPEGELESWLNQGWECVKVYTITKTTYPAEAYYYPPEGRPVNKVIIRRSK